MYVYHVSHFLAPSFYRNSRPSIFLKKKLSSVVRKNSRPTYCLRFSKLGVGSERLVSKTAGEPVTAADFFGMWSLFASVESPLFLVGRMVMTVPNALVALQYAS
jgi:hypothetical protein